MFFRLSSRWVLFVACSFAATALWSSPARAHAEVDIGFFYDGLAPYGQWMNHPSFGWVWFPDSVEDGWRPYTDGRWVYTDAYGWVWDSDYEWGWAPFHYGRWFYEDGHGWLWVPGMEWGPAWVTWRGGGGYVGWAPLPPTVTWTVGTGLGWGGFDVTASTFVPAWTFVEESHFAEPRVREHVVVRARNVELVHMTRDTTNLTVDAGRVRNYSVDLGRVEHVSGRPVPHMRVREASTVEETRLEKRGHDDVPIFRPMVRPGRPAQMPPLRQGSPRVVEQGSSDEPRRGQPVDTQLRQRPDQDKRPGPPPAATQERRAPMPAPQNQQGHEARPPKQKPQRDDKHKDRPHSR